MKSIILILSCLLFINFVSLSQSNEHISNANNFAFEGMKFGSSLSSFELKYPDAILMNNDDENIGVKLYSVFALSSASSGFYSFYGDKLYKIVILYSEKDIKKMGTLQTLVNRLLGKFGVPTDSKKIDDDTIIDAIWWRFESVGKYFEATAYKDGDVRLFILDEDIEKKINEKKASSVDIGF